MTDRLDSLDTDYFENKRLHDDVDMEAARNMARDVVTSALRAGSPDAADLKGVSAYLASSMLHDSEGRDLAFNKNSFSRTELRVAASLAESERLRYLLYRYRFNEYPRSLTVPRMPVILAIEPTSVCNIKCIMCFQMDPELSGKRDMRGFMSKELYTQIVTEAAAKGVGGIVLASRGEPLLHKEIVEFVKIAKDAGILDVKLNTNAIRLNDRTARGLLDAGLDTLVFSVDSAVRDQFEKIRIGAKFDVIVENIRRFNEIRAAEYPKSRTRTRISMVLIDDTQDANEAVEFWRSLVDEFAVRWAIPRLGIYDLGLRPETRACSLLWERLYVWWDGVVNTCDEDYLSRLRIGRLKVGSDLGIEDLWHGDVMSRYRQLHASKRKNELSPCANCPGF